MAHYLVQGSYTSGAWANQIQNPQNRIEQVGKMFASKGVNIITGYYASVSYTHLTLPTNREV